MILSLIVGLGIERLLTPGSIPELLIIIVILSAYFPLGLSSLPVVGGQSDKKLANSILPEKGVLCWCDQRDVECLVLTRINDQGYFRSVRTSWSLFVVS